MATHGLRPLTGQAMIRPTTVEGSRIRQAAEVNILCDVFHYAQLA